MLVRIVGVFSTELNSVRCVKVRLGWGRSACWGLLWLSMTLGVAWRVGMRGVDVVPFLFLVCDWWGGETCVGFCVGFCVVVPCINFRRSYCCRFRTSAVAMRCIAVAQK